ncbi:MAG: type II secretion system F family protein, partial [Actinomycetota bacterium]
PYLSGLKARPSTLLMPRRRASRFGTLPPALVSFLPRQDAELEERIAGAGLDIDPADFRLQQVTWALAGVVIASGAGTLAWVFGLGFDVRALPLLAALAAALGFLGRDWALSRSTIVRRSHLTEELPVAIDLLTLSIMSGESVPGACLRISNALGDGIGREFRSVVADMRAGSSVIEALEGLALRIGDPSAARLVDALCTAVERGSPLADVLRAQAEDAREVRRRRLLEMGGRREVLMLVPVVFLILPTVVVFALFPGLVSLELLVP